MGHTAPEEVWEFGVCCTFTFEWSVLHRGPDIVPILFNRVGTYLGPMIGKD